jgi:single-strand DNA-binding protein
MPRLNQCNFIGHLGGDAEVKSVGSQTVVEFSIGVSPWKKDGGETLWLRCSWWGDRAAKVSGYLRKGDPLFVSGELSVRTYEKRDGTAGASVDLRINDVALLGGGGGQQEQPRRAAAPPRPAPRREPDPVSNDDIPF